MVFSKIRQLSVPVPRPSSGVPLAKEDVEILSEFLNFEDMTEFDADPLLPSRDAATNIIPRKDQIFRLQEIVARQESATRNNTEVIMELQRLLLEKLEDPPLVIFTLGLERERDPR